MSLSFRMTNTLTSGVTPALFRASKTMPAVMAPSPIPAICWRSSPALREAPAMPSTADIHVDECPVPKASYTDHLRLGNTEKRKNAGLLDGWARRSETGVHVHIKK